MPETSRVVVCNTTPLIALALIGKLELLRQLYGKILVPPAVWAEIRAGASDAPGAVEVVSASWIRVTPLQNPRSAKLLVDLDPGEAEVIALATEVSAQTVIIDERLGRRYAQRVGLELTGTLGVLIKAKQLRLVEAIKPLINALQWANIYLSAEIVREALRLAGEAD